MGHPRKASLWHSSKYPFMPTKCGLEPTGWFKGNHRAQLWKANALPGNVAILLRPMPALTIPSRVHDPINCCVPVIPTCAIVTINVWMLTCFLFVAATLLALRHRPAAAFETRYLRIAKLSHRCPCSCIDHLCKCSPSPPHPIDTLQTISPSSPFVSALLSNGPDPRSGSRVDVCIILHHHCNMRFRTCGRRQQSMAGPRV